jgi:hypothetical protein
MAVLPPSATKEEFREYVVDLRGPLSDEEVDDLWVWRLKLQGIKFDVGVGYQASLPKEEQGLTMNEREAKIRKEATDAGLRIEPAGARWV